MFGLSALVRTVGIFAVAAFLAHWWVHTRARHHRWVIVLALAPQLAWSCIKWLRGWHTSYIGSLLDAGPAVATTELLGQLPTNARALWYYAVRTFDLLGSTYSALACALLLGLATLCLVQRLRRGEADALYVVLYLGVLLLWPYPNHGGRFLLMLLPFALAYASWGAGLLVRCAAAARLAHAAEIAVAVLAACIILPSTLLITRQVAQFPSRPEADMVRTSTWYGRDSQVAARAAYIFGAEVLDAIGAMAPHIPPTACVTSTMPEMVMLRTHRASLRPPDADAGPAAMEAVLARCPYVLMLGASAFPAIGYPPYHPLQEVRSQLRALHSVPSSAPSFHDRPLAILAHYRPPSGAIADEDSL